MLISIPFNAPKGAYNMVIGLIQSFQYHNPVFADLYIGVRYALDFKVDVKLPGTDELIQDVLSELSQDKQLVCTNELIESVH